MTNFKTFFLENVENDDMNDPILQKIKNLGYSVVSPNDERNIGRTRGSYAVFTRDSYKNRIETFNNIKTKLHLIVLQRPHISSIGVLAPTPNNPKYIIAVKPGKLTPTKIFTKHVGVGGEADVIKVIKDYSNNGEITVKFIDQYNTKFIQRNVIDALSVGTKMERTELTHSKADILLIDSKHDKTTLSIKFGKHPAWESADSMFKKHSLFGISKDEIIDKFGTVHKIDELNFALDTPIIVKNIPKKIQKIVIFGSDIEPYGAVIQFGYPPDQFGPSKYTFDDKTKTLTFNVSKILLSMDDVSLDEEPVIIIRNSKGRQAKSSKYPGTRILVIPWEFAKGRGMTSGGGIIKNWSELF